MKPALSASSLGRDRTRAELSAGCPVDHKPEIEIAVCKIHQILLSDRSKYGKSGDSHGISKLQPTSYVKYQTVTVFQTGDRTLGSTNNQGGIVVSVTKHAHKSLRLREQVFLHSSYSSLRKLG